MFTQFKAKAYNLHFRSFLRNTMTLASGSAIAQIIALAVAPIVTRLYSPEDFGLFGIFMAISAILVPIATLRYDLAIILPNKHLSAWNLLLVVSKHSILIAFILLIFVAPLRVRLANFFGEEDLAPYLFLLPLLALNSGWLNLASSWTVRHKMFGALSKTDISSSIAGNSFKIVTGVFGAGAGGLIFSALFQKFIHLCTLLFLIRDTIPGENGDSKEGYGLIKRYYDIPLYSMPQDIMASFAANLPNILLAVYFNPLVVGFYLLAYRVTSAPIGFIREAFRKVFYQRASELYNEGHNLYFSVLKMTAGLMCLCTPLLLLLFFYGEALFSVIFGDEWLIAGTYSKYLGILVFASVANTPSVVVIPILNKNKGLLIYEILGTSFRLLTIILAGYFLDAESTVATFCIVSAVANFCLISWILFYLHKRYVFRKAS